MYKDGLKLRQRKKKKRKYNRKIPTATWHPPQLQVLKFRRGTYATPRSPPPLPNPLRGPHVRESKTLWNLDSTQWIPDFRSRGVLPENWVEMCGTLPETLTIFQTKICDFTYPISDLTFKSIP